MSDLADKRQKLAQRAAYLVQRLGSMGKNDVDRGSMVDEKMSVDRQLKEVNKLLKAENVEVNGHQSSDGRPTALEPIHLYAAMAMHALVVNKDLVDYESLSVDAWEIAQAMEDNEP